LDEQATNFNKFTVSLGSPMFVLRSFRLSRVFIVHELPFTVRREINKKLLFKN